RAYEQRLFGVGSEEFRRVIQAGFALTATVAIAAYATKIDVARGYVIVALPLSPTLGLAGRYQLRKRLEHRRKAGACMRRVGAAGPRTSTRPVAGLPLLHVEHPELTGVRRLAKSAFDRTVACAALIVLWPLLAAIVIAIRLESHGPALFRQTRVGRDGREFTVVKFRTMVVDAERRKAELLKLNDHDGVLFKIKNDPRITRIGAWLRRYSLDELPQLFNVLWGDISLVGPRPPPPEGAAQYRDVLRP